MLGIINRSVLLSRLGLSRCHRFGLNMRDYVPWSTVSVLKPFPMTGTKREMCKYVKPISRRAINFQISDGIPRSYELIYTSFEWHTISQYGSAALSTLYIIFAAAHTCFNYDIIFPDLHTSMLNIWISVSFLYVNIGTAIISYKSPVRIYHDKETGDYKAVFNAFNPFDTKVLQFQKGMVERIPPPDILTPLRYCRFKIKGQDLYLFDTYFRYPSDFYNMFDSIDDVEGDN